MKRVGLTIMIIALLMVAAVIPSPEPAQSKTLQEIERELAELRRQMEDAKQNAEYAEQRIVQVRQKREATMAELERIRNEKMKIEKAMIDQENKIGQTEEKLAATETELQETVERIEARNELLKSRLRLMYMNGTVSYLEVLMQSTSFGDFLSRFNALRALAGQDKEILESNKRDKAKLEAQKTEIEHLLASLTKEYEKLAQLKSEYMAREKQSEVLIAQLKAEEAHLHEVTEEEEQFLIAAAAKESQLLREKQRIQLTYSGGKLGFPLPTDANFRKTSDFGTRVDPITGKKGAFHSGIDFGAPAGTDILAAEDGVVIVSGWYGGYGNTVIINHGTDEQGRELWTLYGHASKLVVSVNETVKRGQKIAEVGTTGRSTGNHLHFGVYLDEQAVDPAKYINVP